MSYTALYRKYRPDVFEDVKGQDHIVTVLKNQIKAGRLGHAYLFCGTRGTGKTTIAKLLAKAVNCEHPINGSPCNQCQTCRSIQAQTSMNVIEIDAASNNGVDNIREIVNEVQYSPTEGNYKVYIIDEVHMLSAGAFNALLKTLEEPPSYVMFILATTEVQKIPVTILSRCQRYDFKRITIDYITERLSELAVKEQVEADEKALRYIARMADGALRDALSLLDQCIAFYFGEAITYDKVLEVLGTVDIEVFAALLRYIRKGSVSDCIRILEEITIAGRELTQFTTDFTWYLRNLLLAKTPDDMTEVLEVSSDQLELLRQEAASCNADTLMRYIRIFSDLSNQMKYASQKRVLLEVALIKMCCPEMETDLASLTDRIRKLEAAMKDGVVLQKNSDMMTENETKASGLTSNSKDDQKDNETLAVLQKAMTKDLEMVAKDWRRILENTSSLVRTVLISARPTIGPDNTLLLLFDNPVDKDVAERERHVLELKKAIQKSTGTDMNIRYGVMSREKEKQQEYPDITKLFKNIPIQYVE